jgi:hypothetical protein
MSTILNYVYSFWNNSSESEPQIILKHHINENVEDEYSLVDKKYLISKEDLEKVNLKSSKYIIPGPSRNMPLIDKVNLRALNKAQLDIILSVKLKPAVVNEKPVYYKPRHPVLAELHKKFNVGSNPSFYNKVIQTSNKFDATGINIGKKISDAHKRKISESRKYIIYSEESRKKMSQSKKMEFDKQADLKPHAKYFGLWKSIFEGISIFHKLKQLPKFTISKTGSYILTK